jgi:hypothetical protein
MARLMLISAVARHSGVPPSPQVSRPASILETMRCLTNSEIYKWPPDRGMHHQPLDCGVPVAGDFIQANGWESAIDRYKPKAPAESVTAPVTVGELIEAATKVALLETAVEGIASNRYHPQPGMQCSWCQFKNECMAWLPGMTMEEVRRAA